MAEFFNQIILPNYANALCILNQLGSILATEIIVEEGNMQTWGCVMGGPKRGT